jgi:hypothetical protein
LQLDGGVSVGQANKPSGVGAQFGLLGARETHLLAELTRQDKPTG